MEHRTAQGPPEAARRGIERTAVEDASGAERPLWSAESVLESARWRERHRADTPVDAPPALELDPAMPLGSRIRRSLAVPVIAGGAVFIVAVLIAISATLLQSSGGFGAAGTGAAARPGDPSAQASETQAADGATGGAAAGASATRATDSAGTAGSAKGSSGSASGSGTVFVHVVGEVRSPGLVELPAGSRVADAVEQAGGTTKSAVPAGVNLARVLVDGEQVVVPDESQVSQGSASAGASAPSASSSAASRAAGDGSGGETTAGGGEPTVELNSADLAALESLPGVGPALAQRIIDRRDQSGPFTSVEQLMDVSGIGPKVFAGLRERVTIR